jgi:hypothetical protein
MGTVYIVWDVLMLSTERHRLRGSGFWCHLSPQDRCIEALLARRQPKVMCGEKMSLVCAPDLRYVFAGFSGDLN